MERGGGASCYPMGDGYTKVLFFLSFSRIRVLGEIGVFLVYSDVKLAHLPLLIVQLSLICRIGVNEEGGFIPGSPFFKTFGEGWGMYGVS